MEKCKKIIVLLVMFMLVMSINVYATDSSKSTAEITLTPSKTTVEVGETITVTISAKSETEIAGIAGILNWDKSKLEFTNSSDIANEGFESASGQDAVTGEYELYLYGYSFPKQSDVATLSFKVLETAGVDEILNIKLSNLVLTDANVEDTDINDKEVALTVAQAKKDDESNKGNDDSTEKEPSGEGTSGEGTPGEEDKTNDGNTSDEVKKEEDSQKGEKNPSNSGEIVKDDTTANKVINKAGLEEYIIIAVIGIALVTIILKAKCKKYKDIK